MAAGCSSTGSTARHVWPERTATSTAVAQAAAHGVEDPIGAVPWSQVGPGWLLATWSPAPGHRHGQTPPPGEPTLETATTTLYLVDPAGGRYAITTFPPSGTGEPPGLVDWSGDGSRALLRGPGGLIEVDLHNGKQTAITVPTTVPGSNVIVRYTRPDGKAVLLSTSDGTSERASLARIDLAGNHRLSYPVGPDFRGGYLSTPDGTQLVLGTASGLVLMGNDGTPGKALPVLGTAPLPGTNGCTPVRWWDTASTTVLTRCNEQGHPRLWLVPLGGGAPTALTASISGTAASDAGDVNAWQLPAGIYVQALGGCGFRYLARLNAVGGPTTSVSVPGVQGSIVVVGTNGGHLDLQAKAPCGGGQALFDYDPAAGKSTVLLGPTVNGGGVIEARPFPRPE
jgi:TolB protein